MKPLLFQPGLLTNEYNAGKRTTYLPAIRMYIFISIVFFLCISVKKSPVVNVGSTDSTLKKETKRDQEVSKALVAKTPAEIDHLTSLTATQKKVYKTQLEYRQKQKKEKDQTAEEYALSQKQLPEALQDGYVKYYFTHKTKELKARENIQETFKETLMHNLPKMMFLLLPLFALIMMLIFRKSAMYYAEHFIYALHLHSFLYLFLLVPIFLGMAFSELHWSIYWIVFLGITLYVYKSLRTVYENSRKKTIFKMVLMGTSYSVLLGFCLFLVVIGTFLIV